MFDSRAGVHALGGGIGQGLAMGIGAIGAAATASGKKTFTLAGDGGFILNLGELATAVQERADMVIVLMNDKGYGVIKNIQDAQYGGRRHYVDLHTPDYAQLCQSLALRHRRVSNLAEVARRWKKPPRKPGPFLLEIDMLSIGSFKTVCRPAGQQAGRDRQHGCGSGLRRHVHAACVDGGLRRDWPWRAGAAEVDPDVAFDVVSCPATMDARRAVDAGANVRVATRWPTTTGVRTCWSNARATRRWKNTSCRRWSAAFRAWWCRSARCPSLAWPSGWKPRRAGQHAGAAAVRRHRRHRRAGRGARRRAGRGGLHGPQAARAWKARRPSSCSTSMR
jgi:hypothetical protein